MNVSHASRAAGFGSTSAGLGEEPAANSDCALERLHLGSVQLPFLVAEVRVVRAAGDDQGVVPEPFRRRHRPDRPQVQLTRVEVEVGDLSQQHADVAVALEDRAERIGDLAGRERPGRDLVGEWKRWKLRRSTSVTSTGARRNVNTACRPPKPPPTTTTWWSRDQKVHTVVHYFKRRRAVPGAGAERPGVDLVAFVARP